MDTFRDWVVAGSTLALVVLTALYFWATLIMAKATRHLADETDRQYSATHRPRMRLRFLLSQHILVSLIVDNVGTESALDAKFSISPPMLGLNRDEGFMNLPLFKDGARSIAPGFSLEFVLGTAIDFLGDDPRPSRYVATTSYRAADGRAFSDEVILDLSFVRGSQSAKPPHEQVMAESLKRLADRLDGATSFASKALLITSEREAAKRIRRWEREARRRREEERLATATEPESPDAHIPDNEPPGEGDCDTADGFETEAVSAVPEVESTGPDAS